MRELRKNRRKMWYSLQEEPEPIYERDAEGNILYDELPNGKRIPRKTGEMTDGYNSVVEFEANIAYAGGVADEAPFGVDLSAYSAKLYAIKGKLPLTETTLIWLSEPELPLDSKTADYRVSRVPPSLNETVYLLSRVVK